MLSHDFLQRDTGRRPRPDDTDWLCSCAGAYALATQEAFALAGDLSRRSERLLAASLDAQQSGIYAMQRFARTLRRDIDAVKNAVTECWSNGQTEGQINRLKTLKRAMYGRAGAELLRARMLPLHLPI